MIAIMEKSEQNVDFHQIVDFIEASNIRYALTINPTVYVSHIRQFWSTTRIETTNEGTKILATVDGKPKTISESSIRRNLKLNDEEGISTLPDAELFENLALMGYNILPNQKFTFQKEARQDMENIIKTFALPHDSTPRVTSLDANEGNLEISTLKARIKLLEDKDKGSAEPSGDDAPIKGRSMEIGEEVGVERSTERGSNDIEEMVNVLTSIEAANILTSGVADVSVLPIAGVSIVDVPTVSGLVPTEKVVEFDTPKKKKLQEQINVQVAREIEEEIAREDQRMNEQLARDAKIARIHAEEELQMMIDGLDRSNEMIAKHLHEYEQAAADLSIGEKIDLINVLEQRELYMSVLRNHAGWKTKHFRGERVKRKGLKLEQGSAKKMKTSEEVSEEDLKEMMQLVPVEEVYVEALQVKHPIIDWEIHSEGKKDY
nr:hypothetical protein [Tanacetum cinerariifolium]